MIPLQALFQRRIDGDDALLRLARLRFERAGLAAEVYGGAVAELEWMLRFAPDGPRAPMVHLPRDVDLLAADAPERLPAHWRDLANAERMNLWLRELAENSTLVRASTPAES